MNKNKPKNIKQSVAFLSKLSGSKVTNEEARQSIENITGFFNVLIDWQQKDMGKNALDENKN